MKPRALLLPLALAAAGCGGARASEPIAGPTPLGPKEQRGQIAFMRTCNPCHPQGEGGLGGTLNSKPLPSPMIKAKVRGIVPGDMPKFTEQQVSDEDLDAITDYLKVLRKKAD